MAKYAIKMFVIKLIVSQNKFISHFEYSTNIVKEYPNAIVPNLSNFVDRKLWELKIIL